MRAFVITGPGRAEVRDVPPPEARPGEVVVDVERAGVCGTDVEFFSGAMSYLHTGQARYPMRIGHEWSGTVAAVGAGVEAAWVGRRVTGDTCWVADTATGARPGGSTSAPTGTRSASATAGPAPSPSSSPYP